MTGEIMARNLLETLYQYLEQQLYDGNPTNFDAVFRLSEWVGKCIACYLESRENFT